MVRMNWVMSGNVVNDLFLKHSKKEANYMTLISAHPINTFLLM